MLDRLIRWSLANRALIIGAAILVLVMGYRSATALPLEVLPDLTKPTVTILIESPGLSPEEIESGVCEPVERSLLGIAGLTRLRSSSDIALCLVYAEFEWGTDLQRARQLVQERLQTVRESLPPGVSPYITPNASLMGEILLIGIRSTDGELAPMEVRSVADWTIRRRLQSIPGIAEILNIGGGIKQAQIQPDPNRMQAHDVSYNELRDAATAAVSNTTGGFLGSGPREIMVRNLAMTSDLTAIGHTVIKVINDRPVSIADVATLVWDIEPVRGNAAIDGTPGVIMGVTKSPGFDTISLTEKIETAITELNTTLPPGVEATVLFRQRDFIDRAIGNLAHAVRDGAIMVTVVLFLFLLNFRSTFITLMAMPLSFAVTLLTFQWLGLSVNSMTLGGLAVAIGMVVDDAIVDVENVFRRLRENASAAAPRPVLSVIAAASGEVRNSIFYATLLIILVFVPLLGLSGIEGRLFGPIAFATIISMIASFLVSLTVIPVLCSLVLKVPTGGSTHRDGFLVKGLKWLMKHTILRVSLDQPFIALAVVAVMLAAALGLYPMMGRNFLPSFNEETVIVTTGAAPGTSLGEMEQLAAAIESKIRSVPEVNHIGRRIGRAERSDHIVPLSNVEFDVDFKPSATGRSRAVIMKDLQVRVQQVPGSFSAVAGPLSHRISHMLSGVSSPIAIKVFGPDLAEARNIGTQIMEIAKTIPGLEDARIDQQAPIPQLRIEIDRERALAHGVRPGDINRTLSGMLGGETVAQIRDDQRVIDLAIRLPEAWREDPSRIAELPIGTLAGRRIPLGLVADIREAEGPNAIHRENSQRRFTVAIIPTGNDPGKLVDQLKKAVSTSVRFPAGTYASYEGDFQAEQAAAKRIFTLFGVVLLVMILLLWHFFRSLSLAMQVLVNLPLAIMGGLTLTWLLIGHISVATLVGFIAVGGVAARNGIMMLSHYLHLMRHEGEGFTRSMIERGTLERLVPVTMTALAAGIALIPLVLAAGEPGKEILHPVAVCIVGGLFTSTLMTFAVTPAIFRLFGRKAALRALDTPASI